MKKSNTARRTNQDRNASEIDKLPYEIISNILSRLPIISLLQCRCVCKYWLTIIRDPEFPTAHLARSAHTNPSVILWYGDDTTNPNKLYLVECDDFKTCNQMRWFNTWFRSPRTMDLEMVGSRNGLICLYQPLLHSVPGYVCNPFTGQNLSLPRLTGHPPIDRVLMGFGFDSNSKKYKVVRMLQMLGDDSESLHVEVYTLGTGHWRSKGIIPYNLCWETMDVFVNGALHWISCEDGDDSMAHRCIVSFDVGSEEFGVIQNPGVYEIQDLGVIEGCLSATFCSSTGCVEIWVMRKYGVKESWSKDFVIEKTMTFDPITKCYQALGIHRNGERLLRHESGKLVSYNVESQRFRDLEIHGVPKFNLAYTYVGSLVTLESACGREKMSKRERRNIKRRTR